MNIDFINEPELEFGNGGYHLDIRFGMMSYGPFDINANLRPKDIRIGLIGTSICLEKLISWLDRCSNGIDAKESNQPTLFPKFPGFSIDKCFKSRLVIHEEYKSEISRPEICGLDRRNIVQSIVGLYVYKARILAEKCSLDIIICALPLEILELVSSAEDKLKTEERDSMGHGIKEDIHDLLKARMMVLLNLPIQLVLPSTYDNTKIRDQKKVLHHTRNVQDEATRAWNFHIALYYKAKGIPWRIVRGSSEFTSCFIGICFYYSLDKTKMLTSIAQVFNERGEGLILKGAPAEISDEDRQPHLTERDAESLLNSALQKYRDEHGNFPARVVMHKTSDYSASELGGFNSALKTHNIYTSDLMAVKPSFIRLFREGAYPPLRGTFLSLDSNDHLLYTHGSVDFFKTYPGMYVPRTLRIKLAQTNQTPQYLAEEILALTKMNWNVTQFNGFFPVTIDAARKVGQILKYVDEGQSIQNRYSFYM